MTEAPQRTEAEERALQQQKAYLERQLASACGVTWGNCGENPAYFGKPTDTPHICKGGKRHAFKLHICETCGCVGHPVRPVKGSKAYRQLEAYLLAGVKDRTAQRAQELPEISQPPGEITDVG